MFWELISSTSSGCAGGLEEPRLMTKYHIRGLLEKYLTFGLEKETGLLGALET